MTSNPCVRLLDYVPSIAASALAPWANQSPWELTQQSMSVVRRLLSELNPDAYAISNEVAVHRSAQIEVGAVLKGPAVMGPGCFVAAGAYVRGGCWLDEACTLGPGSELKSSFLLTKTSIAHLNFVGDSVLGSHVNLEAGSIICNHRNERANKSIYVRTTQGLFAIGCDKFGALIGDGSQIGANAVLAPGTLLHPATVIGRGSLCDQDDADHG